MPKNKMPALCKVCTNVYVINCAKAKHAARVALECAIRMRAFYRDVTHENVPRVYGVRAFFDGEFIEYIPDTHSYCKYGCDDSTHREFA